MDKVPNALRDKLGVAIGQQVYKAYRDMLASDRWRPLANFGARPQRLLFSEILSGPAAVAGPVITTHLEFFSSAVQPAQLCQHWNQGSQGVGCSLYQRACCAEHDQYHAGRKLYLRSVSMGT